jgi:thioredoxin-like negative regulator of GroEL
MEKITEKETFEKLISKENPVIMKFYTDWCPDCKRLEFFIGDIIKEYSHYEWYEINKDEFPEIAEKYNVLGIPSLLVFQKGEKKAHLHSANAKTPEEVKDFLNSVSL